MTRLPMLAGALLAATALLASPALADEGRKGPGHGKGKHGGWKAMAFETLDTNKDGGVTLAELKAGMKDKPRMLARADKMFGRLDADKDGKATKAEFDAWKARRAQMRGQRHGGNGQ